ncbi:MAG: KTSC domain-containing protein [Solirubrobacterales bacterium]|mgnify:CR=1 FL=1|nr:KTSC domain-containing protein [Solirubrobacterales bacterium]
MKRVDVDSSAIKRVGYAEESQTLEVTFNQGEMYEYLGVPPHHFEAMTSGNTSVGRYFAEQIRDGYRYRRLR